MFYVNGALATCSNSPTNAASDDVFAIGSSIDADGGNYHHFEGALEDIGLWDRALSAEEVEILFNATSSIFGCTDPRPATTMLRPQQMPAIASVQTHAVNVAETTALV